MNNVCNLQMQEIVILGKFVNDIDLSISSPIGYSYKFANFEIVHRGLVKVLKDPQNYIGTTRVDTGVIPAARRRDWFEYKFDLDWRNTATGAFGTCSYDPIMITMD